MILDSLTDALSDSILLLPFLFFAYLLMEYVEHKSSEKMEKALEKMGKLGPLVGSVLGCVPQCGFSASASSLYSAGIISCGTLLAVFLSTSDEALPILIGSEQGREIVIPLIICKVLFAIFVGFCVDAILRKTKQKKEKVDLCRHCGCSHDKGILKPALWHTLHIFAFVLLINFILNISINLLGTENISHYLLNGTVFQPFAVAAFGLIPNCAISVAITELYLAHSMSFGAAIAGLCANGGTGLAVLLKMNKSKKENIRIIAILYVVSVIFGVVLQAFNF